MHFRVPTKLHNECWYPIPCSNLITALWVILIRFGEDRSRFFTAFIFFWWDAVVEFSVQGFLGAFRFRIPLFYFGGSATPIASEPVQCTDLVDASKFRWGGKKITNRVKGETSSDPRGKLQSPALTTSSAGNSQRLMQC